MKLQICYIYGMKLSNWFEKQFFHDYCFKV